jgi:hypothetical protein
LDTSDQHATQINLVKAAFYDTTIDPSLGLVQLRIPILDSQKLESHDYCATFSNKPPSRLTLMGCGHVEGQSQSEHQCFYVVRY